MSKEHDAALREAVDACVELTISQYDGCEVSPHGPSHPCWPALLAVAMRDPRVQAGVLRAAAKVAVYEDDILSLVSEIERGETTLEVGE